MLSSKVTQTIKQIVSQYLPDNSFKIFIFGSRAAGNNRPFSDIDLGINGPRPLSPKEYITLREAFDESDLPYRVDLVDFKQVSDKFKQISLNKVISI